MRAKKAKLIRKIVYGDNSLKNARSYLTDHGSTRNDPDSLRAIYQKYKKIYKNNKNETRGDNLNI